MRAIKWVIVCGTLIAIFGGGIYGFSSYQTNKKNNAVCTNKCNVLLISVDSLRADHLSAYGYNRATSPNFDSLATKGTLFKNYYSTSFLTPVTEGTVQTGLYPTSSGMTNFNTTLPKDHMILPQYLKQNGYKTHAILSSPEFYYYPSLKESFSRGYDTYQFPNAKDISPGKDPRRYPSINSITNALQSDKKSDKPSFVWTAFGAVHWPFGKGDPNIYADQNYNGVFAGKNLDLPLFMNVYNGYLYPSKTPLTKDDVQYVRDQYDNGVRAFDAYLGQITQQLKKLHLQNKTIIVIESEHGEELGEHGYFAHYDILDNQVHTPLLIIDPRVKAGKQISSVVGSADILPTLLDLTDIPKTSDLEGNSLQPLITGKESDGSRKFTYLQRISLWEESALVPGNTPGLPFLLQKSTGAKDLAIRTDKWMYINRLSKQRQEEISWWKGLTGQPVVIPSVELFDILNDPGETKNVAKDHPEVVQLLSKQLDEWYASISPKTPQSVQKTELVQPYQ